jgi:hypothetical protein
VPDYVFQLRNVLLKEASKRKPVNMYEYMERLALDALSSAGTRVSLRWGISAWNIEPMPGFGYEMDAIEGTLHNPLRQAFHHAFAVTRPSALITALRKYIPLIRFIASVIQCNLSILGINVPTPPRSLITHLGWPLSKMHLKVCIALERSSSMRRKKRL